MIKIELSLELVETLINPEYTGSVLLLEIKEAMENSICVGLVEGRAVSLAKAFKEAWQELVEVELPIDMSVDLQ